MHGTNTVWVWSVKAVPWKCSICITIPAIDCWGFFLFFVHLEMCGQVHLLSWKMKRKGERLRKKKARIIIDLCLASSRITGVLLSAPRYNWWAHLTLPSSCMLVNLGPLQHSSTEEYKPWKWGATARYYTSHTRTMLPMRKSMPRSGRQLDHTTSWRS